MEPLFYALVIICATLGNPVCDPEHAVFAEQSPPIYSSDPDCQNGAHIYLLQQLAQIGAEFDQPPYTTEIVCERAILWDEA
jgi:hypothetical protein